ncbi:sigma-54-dependent Fis family transcriptional regulator [Candidatus Sumerlaeota bacterium]|nr:sigma-54-dependent Fis family transcriptional regulator [Candidatus Sumerlaeota bacterium]
MPFISKNERRMLEVISELTYVNPFLPERIALERSLLGEHFHESRADWNVTAEINWDHPNVIRVVSEAEKLQLRIGEALKSGGAEPSTEETRLYIDLVLFLIYHRYRRQFDEMIEGEEGGVISRKVPIWQNFWEDYQKAIDLPGLSGADHKVAAHFFAGFFQVRRAFYHIFRSMIGGSRPMTQLRAQVWQSIFTHDMRRYSRLMHQRMQDMTCLITGPSGTGKELVARAIGLSRYIPFDTGSMQFAHDFSETFFPLNLSALSPTLIESELFGHKKGAFTGALQDRAGWLEACPAMGTVFLDEIGDITPEIQVKLLRVLQQRVFNRLGDTQALRFQGKIIAATNRDLAREIEAGRFREDLYYRICSDRIVTPSLHEQIADNFDTLPRLVRHIAERLTTEDEADGLAAEVMEWVEGRLGREYAWPGNVRELEQCVRNILIRKEYHPHGASRATSDAPFSNITGRMQSGDLPLDELLQFYCSWIYAQSGNYQEAARRLQVDHRTVKARVDQTLVEQFQQSQNSSTQR